jgi:3'(2'), 5'-bisphosphate nucleotidase
VVLWRRLFSDSMMPTSQDRLSGNLPPAADLPAVPLPAGVSIDQLLVELRRLSWGAADILRAYGRGQQPPYGFPTALSVDDGGEGPVSAADLAVNQWLLEGLEASFPSAGWILLSEETAKQQLTPGHPLDAEWLWILDPLDGTKDFLQGTGEYAVHLALTHLGKPVLGVVMLPEMEELWLGLIAGDGTGSAWCENRAGDIAPARLSHRRACSELVLVASRNHRDARLEQLLNALALGDTRAIGSVGGKVATILRGETDLYISLSGRSAPKDWDMAAPEAVLRAAGGQFTHADGRPLTYNTGDIRQAGCLIASHGPSHAELCRKTAEAMAAIDPEFGL